MRGSNDSFYRFAWELVHTFFRVFFRLEVRGHANVPSEGGVILAANHVSVFDPPIVGVSTKRTLSFLAKRELFQSRLFGGLISRLNAIPVERGAGDRRALQRVLEALRQGEAVLVFPEGGRSRDGHLQRPKNGVGMIAVKTAKPIVPVYVSGTGHARRTLLRQQKAGVVFGRPFGIEELSLTNDRRSDYRLVSEEVMERIRGLRDGEEQG
jgi:1-acyl-sn-glycerol-3-phosphate acyltransferase